MTGKLFNKDVFDGLSQLPDESVQMCVTSPPYWGLRDYGIEPQIWDGDDECEHVWGDESQLQYSNYNEGFNKRWGNAAGNKKQEHGCYKSVSQGQFCQNCGAWRGSLGLEPTPELYVKHMTQIFREVRRVLRPDGTLWLNLGDSYATGGHEGGAVNRKDVNVGGWGASKTNRDQKTMKTIGNTLKPKDLIGIPWRVAFALQQPYIEPTCVKSEVDRAWMAAAFDTDGAMGIRRFNSYRKEVKQTYQDGYVAYTVLTNSDKELLDHCIELTGFGSAKIKQKAGYIDNRKIITRRDSYGWRLDGNNAISVVKAIYPYLIVKRKQACLLYTLDQLNKSGRKERGNKKVPKENQEKRVYLHELVKKCNQREKIDLPNWVQEPKQEVEPGWYLRSDIIWHKTNPMPESVTDRPTKSHEYLFLMSKSQKYFYDVDAIREPASYPNDNRGARNDSRRDVPRANSMQGKTGYFRNKRTVWTIPTQPYKEAHFATYPEKLIQPCILAGTSQKGCCPECGAPWERVIQKGELKAINKRGLTGGGTIKERKKFAKGIPDYADKWEGKPGRAYEYKTIGWKPTCKCGITKTDKCTVLDVFLGSGTTGLVCEKLSRKWIGIEINPEYCEIAKDRIEMESRQGKLF